MIIFRFAPLGTSASAEDPKLPRKSNVQMCSGTRMARRASRAAPDVCQKKLGLVEDMWNFHCVCADWQKANVRDFVI